MDLKQIEYFVRVAELGSFTRASVALSIAQPALSRQVRELEVDLRQHLLQRHGRGVTLTDAGKLMLEHGRGILHQVARAREDLDRARGALTGQVSVGLPPSLARVLTVQVCRAFRQHLPEATLSITEGLSTQMQDWLQTGRLDVALLYNAPVSSELSVDPFMEEELFVVSPRPDTRAGLGEDTERPARLEELARDPLIVPSRPNALRMVVERRMADLGLAPRIAMEIDGVPAILDLVSEGLGYAVLPRHAVLTATKPERYLLRPVRPARLVAEVSIVTSTRRITTATQQRTIELVKAAALSLQAKP